MATRKIKFHGRKLTLATLRRRFSKFSKSLRRGTRKKLAAPRGSGSITAFIPVILYRWKSPSIGKDNYGLFNTGIAIMNPKGDHSREIKKRILIVAHQEEIVPEYYYTNEEHHAFLYRVFKFRGEKDKTAKHDKVRELINEMTHDKRVVDEFEGISQHAAYMRFRRYVAKLKKSGKMRELK